MAKKRGKSGSKKPKDQSKPQSFRESLEFYLIDSKTNLGKGIDLAIIFVNLIVLAIFVSETYVLSENTLFFLFTIDIIAGVFFIGEYIVRLYAAPNRMKQIFDIYSIIDLIAIIPTLYFFSMPFLPYTFNIGFIKLVRAFRVLRVFRFLRFTVTPDFFFGRITMHLLKVVRLVLTIFLIFFVASGIFYHVEHVNNPYVNNFTDAFYFTVITLTTVGFGDIIPTSEGGKWVTIFMIISGIIMIPWQAAQIVKEWIFMANKKQVICKKCGLRYHDKDASHCKHCGSIIYQEVEGS